MSPFEAIGLIEWCTHEAKILATRICYIFLQSYVIFWSLVFQFIFARTHKRTQKNIRH